MQFTRVQSVFEWINDLCQLKFDPIFTTFFLTVRAFVFGYVWMTLSGPILNQTALGPALIFPIIENSIFSCLLKDFSSFLLVLL